MNQLQIKTMLQIAKPMEEVFEAIVDPGKMSNYFISEGSARMEEGKTIMWKFPEFEESFPVKILKLASEHISMEWEGTDGKLLEVNFYLSERPANNTLVTITEGKMQNNGTGIKWLTQNTEGWANFLACMKAYLEYGINLRKGGFDFMKE